MYIPTTLYGACFILHAETIAKIAIKGTISQLLLGNYFLQIIGNPFQSPKKLTSFFLRKYVLLRV